MARHAFLARESARIEATLSTHAITLLFLVSYGISVSMMFLWGFYTEFTKYVSERSTLFRVLIGMARGAGYTLNLNCALVILLAARLFLTALRNTPVADVLPLDVAFPSLHILVAYAIVGALFIHVSFHFSWIIKFDGWGGGLWGPNMTVATGGALLLVFLAMFIFARPSIRSKYFKLFYFIHLIGAALFFVLLIFHGMYDGKPETYKYIAGPLIIYLADRIIRRWRASTHSITLSASQQSLYKDDQVLQLSVPRPFDFLPGQYAEIKVPAINNEWHPFTIASAPYEDDLTFFIKDLGDWTHALHENFSHRLDSDLENASPLPIQVRGPYGAPCQDTIRYNRVVLVSGGIGATPFASICKHIHHLHSVHDTPFSRSHRASHAPRPSDRSAVPSAAIDLRLRSAVAQLYDVDFNQDPSMATDDVRAAHVADMLRLSVRTQANAKDLPSSSSEDQVLHIENNDESSSVAEDDRYGDSYRNSKSEDDDNFSSHNSDVDDEYMVNPPSSLMNSMKTPLSCIMAKSANGKKSWVKKPEKAYRKHGESLSISKFSSIFQKPVFFTPTDKAVRQKTAHLLNVRSNLLMFLHTTRVSFFLLMLAIARGGVVAAGAILNSDFASLKHVSDTDSSGVWVSAAYSVISLILAVILSSIVLLEGSLLGGALFSTARRCTEVIMFGPLAIVTVVIEMRRWIINDPGDSAIILVQYVLIQVITFALLCGRLWRSLGRRGLVDDGLKKVSRAKEQGLPDADFVWTTPKASEDGWLRRELTPLSDGRSIRVHRYVTRGRADAALGDMEEGVEADFLKATKEGRPDWDACFNDIARETKTDSVVGIFFCGPHAMGKAIKESAKRVEMWCNLRDAYLRFTPVETIMSDIGLPSVQAVERLQRFGGRIRFVYREEKFN